ncbi:ATP-dependent helicase, partial [Paenibacillus graminis]|nr:ATP-dependent helicase [Paenibacillus graminis]
MYTRNITVQLALSQYGDALIYGINERDDYVSGLLLKQQLFAWHEESFYGTELTTQNADGVELVILPAEQVIPFFADLKVLRHIGWSWEGNAGILTALAPVLAALLDEKQYVPSFSAFREGQLRWAWDGKALAGAAGGNPEAEAGLRGLRERSGFEEGLQAAFSAAVFQRYYSTEAEAGDLRSEFPLLFSRSGLAAAGMDADSWLMSIGWKADSAPFRPVLQLLEPDGDSSFWRLQLLLQDKRDESALVPLRLSDDGEPHGRWPATW